MATLITGTVKEGHICEVNNEQKKLNAATTYLQLFVEMNGKEYAILMTEHEYNKAEARSVRRRDLVPTGSPIFNSKTRKGHFSVVLNTNKKHRFEADKYYVSKVIDRNDVQTYIMFTQKEMDRIENRTAKNSEDIVKKSFFTDLID